MATTFAFNIERIMKEAIFLLTTLLYSCANKQENIASTVKGDNFIIISKDEVNGRSACEIKNIYALFSNSSADSFVTDIEGQVWYQISLKDDKSNWVLIESSMENFKLLSRVTIKSARVKTQSGIKIGTTLKEVEDLNLTVSILDDMDDLSFSINEDKISFRINNKFERNGEDFRTLVGKFPDAEIIEFVITPTCK